METLDPEDTEVMMEVYLQEIHSIRAHVGLIQHRISNTESLVMLKLDSVRNYLLTADVIFSMVATCLTFGMFVTGAFGMNLHSGLEGDSGTVFYFWGIFALTITTSIAVCLGGVWYFRRRGVIM